MRFLILVSIQLAASFSSAVSLQTEVKSRPWSLLALDQSMTKTVLNGRSVQPNEEAWTHSVLIEVGNGSRIIGRCSGTIIAKDTVLTAGHCFTTGADRARIVFGSKGDGWTRAKSVDAAKIVPLRDYRYIKTHGVPMGKSGDPNARLDFDVDSNKEFQEYFDSLTSLHLKTTLDSRIGEEHIGDLALIFFKNGPPRKFKPAKIFNGQIPMLKEDVYIYGYGLDTRMLNQRQSILREAKEKVYSYYLTPEGKPYFFLSYSGGPSLSNSCAGDSGGGVYVRNVSTGELQLIGVQNNVSNSCANGTGSLFLDLFIPWIEKQIQEFRSTTSM